MDSRRWRDSPGHGVLMGAFALAARSDGQCRPVHVLGALAEVHGPIGDCLRPAAGGPLYVLRPDAPGGRGATSTYLCGQVQGGAAELAADRAEDLLPAHLLLVVLDQGDAEVVDLLQAAGLDLAEVRKVALTVLGEPLDRPRLALPSLTPAGTMDRPPLPIEELDARLWSVLVWRQEHLPLHRIRRVSDWHALSSLEYRAVWKLADRLEVDDDKRYSFLAHHHDDVARRVHGAHPSLVDLPDRSELGLEGRPLLLVRGSRRRLGPRLPRFMVGWPTWFANRRAGLRDRWFRLTTYASYRGQPDLN